VCSSDLSSWVRVASASKSWTTWHSRNGAADHVESQVVQLFEADATLTHVELLTALLVFAGEPGGESGMTVEAEEMQHHARLLRCELNQGQRHFGILAIARRIHG